MRCREVEDHPQGIRPDAPVTAITPIFPLQDEALQVCQQKFIEAFNKEASPPRPATHPCTTMEVFTSGSTVSAQPKGSRTGAYLLEAPIRHSPGCLETVWLPQPVLEQPGDVGLVAEAMRKIRQQVSWYEGSPPRSNNRRALTCQV
jgi:hypothetical protein